MRRISFRNILCTISLSVLCLCVIFLINNATNSNDIDESLNIGCDCSSKQGELRRRIPPVVNTNVLKPCEQVEKTSPVQRAIIIYYPNHQSDYFFPEVRWLYRSWVEILRYQPTTWRTDLIVFTYNFTDEFRRLGCVNRLRKDKEEPSICRLFLYVPIQFRTKNITDNHFQHAFDHIKHLTASYKNADEPLITVPKVEDTKTFDANRSESLYANLRTYGYIDSINTIYEGYWTFQMYDFVLRTDIDVFIYRHFADYIPQNCTLITGGGGYGTIFNRRKLTRIAHDMGFAHANISGMGSTWYGSPYDGYLVANQTLHGMLWLVQYEFSQPERESKLGTLLWPDWHYGVLLLYGQHLALNHLVAMNEIRILIGNKLLDQSTTDKSVQYVQQSPRLNLHCWHTAERFSKFAFKMGQYNQTDLEMYRNDTTAQAYAMRMALESKYMTLEELAAYGRNGSSSSSS